MDSELFLKWLHHFIMHAPEERPLVLIMDQHETHVPKDVIMFCKENSGNSLPTCPHHTYSSAPGYCGFQPTEDCFLHHGSQDGSGARGHCCGEEAVFSSPQTCVLGVDRLSAWPILSIFTIIDIGHSQNRFFFFLCKHYLQVPLFISE